MSEPQTYVPLSIDTLLAKVRELRDQNCRLVQIGVTPVGETLEINYSFDQAGRLLNFRLTLPAAGARLPSISGIYRCAFIYENEIHDLFRVQVDGIAIDYKGKFYRTTVPFPFSGRTQTAGVTPTGVVTAASTSVQTAPAPAPTGAPAAPQA